MKPELSLTFLRLCFPTRNHLESTSGISHRQIRHHLITRGVHPGFKSSSARAKRDVLVMTPELTWISDWRMTSGFSILPSPTNHTHLLLEDFPTYQAADVSIFNADLGTVARAHPHAHTHTRPMVTVLKRRVTVALSITSHPAYLLLTSRHTRFGSLSPSVSCLT